jgi:phage terminase large subunit-like protein
VCYSPESGSKVYRADDYASECEQGNVWLLEYPKDHPDYWDIDAYLDELCSFPVGKTKDQVDASARACKRLLGKGTLRVGSAGF